MIRTRFAPSPTGYLHVGGLRTALFSYLWAKKNKGQFILRIEDTDQKRLVPGAVAKLVKVLNLMGLAPDEGLCAPGKEKGKFGPYIQSKRLKNYQKAALELVQKGKAYYCFCSSQRLEKLRAKQQADKQVPKYDGFCRALSDAEVKSKLSKKQKAVIRFKLPENQTVLASDLIHGEIKVATSDLDDFILLKSDGYATYHLANVVDDHHMQISHVIRAEEWLPSLPKHILLYQAFAYPIPTFVHLPLLLNPDRSKLSKRQGDVAVEDYLQKGYLPQALINYCALLGWNPGGEKEIFSLSELTQLFSIEKINKSGAIFDIQKLNWFNAAYIRQIIQSGGADYKNLLKETAKFLGAKKSQTAALLKLFGQRLEKLSDLSVQANFLWKLPSYQGNLLIFKKSDLAKTKLGLNQSLQELTNIKSKDFDAHHTFAALEKVVKDNNLTPGDVFWPIRVAVSGLEKSPAPSEIMEFLGDKESIKRIKQALAKLK